LVAGCVNLTKPEQVAECAAKGKCLNDAATGLRDGKLPGFDGVGDLKPINADGSPGDPPTVPDGGAAADALVTPVAIDGNGPADLADVADLGGPADGPRDISSIDVPAGACLASGKLLPAGTVCRPAVDLCDVAESCDGTSADCPADKLAKAGTSCRPTAGDCDIAETCDGINVSCPVDGFMQAGTVCRKVAVSNLCDVPESCTGTSPTCPVDSVAPANTVCHPSKDNNQCDPTETCTGTSVTCPTDQHYDRPIAPANPTATPGTLQTTVAWSESAGATGYNVKRSAKSGSGYTTLGGVPTMAAPPRPYVDKGLTGGISYYYVVSAINTIATCESPNSAEVTATPIGLCTPPAAPAVTATSANGTVELVWAQVAGAVSYTIARSSSSGTGYATLAQISAGTTTSYTDSNVVNGTTYYYVITASNGTCSSVDSAEVSAAPACTAPTSPTGLAATPGDKSVTLKWTASAGAISYSIYRKATGDQTYKLVNSTSTTTFTDTTVANGTVYSYVLTASNGSCSSANSTEAQVTPACVPPSPPTGVTATPGDGEIALTWTASTGATSYQVSRNTTGTGSFTPIATPTTTNYLDKPVTNGAAYYYVVGASNGSCASPNSAVASATAVCTPPSVPGTITATAGDTKVTLSWGGSTPAPASYSLQRKTGASGTWATIASPTVASYADNGLTNDTVYYYQVSASNGSCSSVYNTAVSATPGVFCAQTAPTNLVATATGSVQVTLTWSAATPAPPGGYNIARSTNSTAGFTSIGTVTSSTLTYVDSANTLVKDTVYYYQATAVGATCTTTSSTVSATTACANPAVPSPSATADATGNITVTWAAIAGTTAYTVYRSTTSGGTYTAVSSNQTAATYTDPAAGLTDGSVYYYKVSASNASGQCSSSQSSPAVSAMSCAPPAAPIGLTRTVGTSGQVMLSWTASTGATQYIVLRGTASGAETQVATTASNSYADTSLVNDTTYYYTVKATNGSNNACVSAASTELVATPRACQVLPASLGLISFNTTDAFCFVICRDLSPGDPNYGGWGCDLTDGRTLTVNGQAMTTCGGPLPARSNGALTFRWTAGSFSYAWTNWWGKDSADCPP
jgi:fibronectin type 3 domain-containing protein